jgi:TolB protein
MQMKANKTRKMNIIVAVVGNDTSDMRTVSETVKDDLGFTGQFDPSCLQISKLSSKKELLSYHSKAPLLLVLSDVPKKQHLEWRLYETKSARMVAGKKIERKGSIARGWGHVAADQVLEALTDQKGPFSTQLVYCKEDPLEKNKTKICVADFNTKHEKVLADLSTLAIAPRWNGDAYKPVILYSEYTLSNMRLMSLDMEGKRTVATNFDGLNMLPSFSKDGKEAVLCLSVEGSSQIYKYYYNKQKKRPEYLRLTDNDGNNLSPTLMENGDILFCSDYETRRPQIYIMSKKGKIQKISEGGCCTSPTYNEYQRKIAYSKLINGVSQILVYDLETEMTQQITKDLAHKEEASWSPCGNYLVFSVTDKTSKRLAIESLLTGQRRFITDNKHRYSYPSWSGTHVKIS